MSRPYELRAWYCIISTYYGDFCLISYFQLNFQAHFLLESWGMCGFNQHGGFQQVPSAVVRPTEYIKLSMVRPSSMRYVIFEWTRRFLWFVQYNTQWQNLQFIIRPTLFVPPRNGRGRQENIFFSLTLLLTGASFQPILILFLAIRQILRSTTL